MPPTAASGHYNTRNMPRILLYSENTGKICDIDLPEFQLSKRAPTKWAWPSIGKRTRLGERWGWSGHLRDGLRRRGEPHRADRSEHLACFLHTKHPREQNEKNEQKCFLFAIILIILNTSFEAHWKPATTLSLISFKYWTPFVTSQTMLGPVPSGPKHQIFRASPTSSSYSSARIRARSLISCRGVILF